ncbi:hypothetical protein MNBD_GAMMA19-1652 [hydrothermal vent metagenome]|uniref:Uncharacterized protein n=1 Tax=hydrothermal vent metagenome TaxID=652676 RepID=A0A3B1B0I3_9ZZZZ
MKHFFHALVGVFVLALSITNITQAGQLALPAADIIAPVVTQNNHVSTIEAGEDHQILVTVTDNIAIKSVILFYRGIGNSEYQAKTMRNVAGTDDYGVTISADQVSADGLEYYIRATDSAGNTLLHGYAFSPVTVTISSPLAGTTLTALSKPEPKSEKETSYKWLWIGLGVLAVGAVAAGGGGGDDTGIEQSTISITAPVPVP